MRNAAERVAGSTSRGRVPADSIGLGAARSHGHPSAVRSVEQAVLSLQRIAGNLAVAQLVQDDELPMPPSSTSTAVEEETLHTRHEVSGFVRRPELSTEGPTTPQTPHRWRVPVVAASEADAPPGAEEASVVDPRQVAIEAPPPVEEPEQGGTVPVPDLQFPTLREVEEQDAITSAIPYAPTITQAGATPNGFGVTRAYDFSLTNISITKAPAGYIVTATLENPIKFQVRASSGPDGQENITGASSSELTATNFPTAVSDLTPDTGDLNGRPPRTQFWSKSLTIRHERYHCTDGQAHAATGAANANTWLNSKTASSAAQVTALLNQLPQRVIAHRRANMTYPGREERAYGDGAASYQALADAIKTEGDAGNYPS